MRFVGRSLTARLTAAVVALIALVSVVVVSSTAWVVGAYVTDQLDADLTAAGARAQRALLVGPHTSSPDGGPPPAIREARGQGTGTLTAYLAGGEGRGQRIDSSGVLRTLDDDVLDALAGLPVGGGPVTVDLTGLGEYRVQVEEVDGITVVTGLPTAPVEEARNTVTLWGLGLGTVATLLGGTLAALVVRRQLRPLREVAVTAQDVAATDLTTGEIGVARVPQHLEDPRTEVGRMALALNAALDHVESALDQRRRSEAQARQLLADVSHELRTPLATVSGYAELGLRGQDPDGVTHALGKVQEEARRMTAMVEDLLLLARLDAGRALAVEEVDLTRMVVESVADARVTGPDHRWRLELPEEVVTVQGDALRLHQVLSNLLANARQHTPPGTTVTTGLVVEDDRVLLGVTDDGPGISPEFVGEVFTRFARGDAARSRSTSGAGLGLPLARSIVRAHGGDLTVASEPGRTRFEVSLPRARVTT
ncbi:sensor histidine kinase [Nocardioides jishulii]|uniref:histidine kinase n=1 Tax=Nocardioides jishulii TaxID=2575440 RepID=A0A4U2YRM9_9ACTN|nr:HAMP domain-containing sensor histidine kinase [Nocardioides jishulii]QCX26153.1 HAMP domain-containing histidine kinase [Nocardioides jishulii]TKI64048.1 HAMP domain-containing histidine kinase [Nocardioides jishulii]